MSRFCSGNGLVQGEGVTSRPTAGDRSTHGGDPTLKRRKSLGKITFMIGMPDYDGYFLIGKVRAREKQEGMIPAIALTAYGTPADRDRALSAGYQVHIIKPFEAAELVSTIANLSGRYTTGRWARRS